ncbi:unnamed protein product [Rhizoctonia solani]|uniref:Uncharacterized protein n=1 Tax=Rhizoctonia solani TaxID=456999 RepID=A0A8H3I279_9AGAM|nr:unnamed protein product [Rhizoctonia solani]
MKSWDLQGLERQIAAEGSCGARLVEHRLGGLIGQLWESTWVMTVKGTREEADPVGEDGAGPYECVPDSRFHPTALLDLPLGPKPILPPDPETTPSPRLDPTNK